MRYVILLDDGDEHNRLNGRPTGRFLAETSAPPRIVVRALAGAGHAGQLWTPSISRMLLDPLPKPRKRRKKKV
jgi:hypothetical protein